MANVVAIKPTPPVRRYVVVAKTGQGKSHVMAREVGREHYEWLMDSTV